MDTQSVGNFSLSPWTRDVGQQVAMPHDLVTELEEPARQLAAGDGLGRIGDYADPALPGDLPNPAWWPSASGVKLRMDDTVSALPVLEDGVAAVALGGAAVGLAALKDKSVHQQFTKHQDNRWVKGWDKVGRAAPALAVGVAGAAMALSEDPVLVNTSIISLQSATVAAGVSMAGKRVFDRARPGESGDSTWQRASNGNRSFPSNHAAVTMAAITPFAEEYQLPWLYMAGGLASVGRVAGGKHWLSDVVAGSLLGYGTGYALWKGQRNTVMTPAVSFAGKGVALNLRHQY
jgi:membrane-associated phospholipid phosphatase